MSGDPRNHLLWTALAANLESGRGNEVAFYGSERIVSYATLAAAVAAGAREIDARFPTGSRILLASRDQLHVGVALLAALQSRAIPLLADPTSPERLGALAATWGVAGMIGAGETLEASGIDGLSTERVSVWLDEPAVGAFEPHPVAAVDAAFWTFTSGTTGEPKAVVHAHRGPLAAHRAFAERVLRLGPEDVTIATAGLPFVYALGNNFFFPLMAGGAAILPQDLLLPTVLGELARHGATVFVAGPWSLSGIVRLARRARWVEALRRLRCVLSAGESLPPRVFLEWQERFGKEVLDNLGCTEMFNSFVSNFPGRALAGSLGEVVPGFEARVGGKEPAPGARGKLEVRGESRAIAAGAAGRLSPPEGDWCATGDDVEVRAGGDIVFLGRRDDRFKVKGRFLHPLEAERVLGRVEGVVECMVSGESDAEGLTIVTVKVVAEPGADESRLVKALFREARAKLEPHAVPARIELVDTLPRSARGKLLRA